MGSVLVRCRYIAELDGASVWPVRRRFNIFARLVFGYDILLEVADASDSA
jgi:hypothetical protein